MIKLSKDTLITHINIDWKRIFMAVSSGLTVGFMFWLLWLVNVEFSEDFWWGAIMFVSVGYAWGTEYPDKIQ